MTDRRRGEIVALRTAVGDALPDFAGWTDEQWSEHDRKIADARAKDLALSERDRLAARWAELRDAGFPVRAIEFAQNADSKSSLIARLGAWSTEANSALVVSGPKGCGKTVAATWWASRRTGSIAFVRAATFAASTRYDRAQRDAWFSSSALVLDDLGAEFNDSKGSFLVDLDELVDVFYGDRKPLLITTNATKDEFEKRYGERVSDRLRECARWYSTSAPSMRGRR